MEYIDLRSDTVTQPTQEMRDAMYTAPVGDDMYGDDPTVKNLEQKCAQMMGKEAGLFVASGTMGNQLCVMTHTVRGDEIIVSSDSHIVVHEVGMAAVLAGVMVRAVECKDGMLTAKIIEKAVNKGNDAATKTSLICLENALCNGKVMTVEQMRACYEKAKEYNLPVHLDGARIFNACVALKTDVKNIAQYSDSVMVCLSKGLCAPVGSVVCGSAEFVERARKNRKLLGGGMRQAGLLAACGIIALEKMVDRLQDDHDNAKLLAQELNKIKGVKVLMDNTDINIVFASLDRPKEFINAIPSKMLEKGIKINGIEGGYLRFVTNNDVSRRDIEKVVEAFKQILG
ncbi:MAG: low-specificity L-threonine aldolase [Oscillospiraceae bacterium]